MKKPSYDALESNLQIAQYTHTSMPLQSQNPYTICMWQPLSECENCSLYNRLKCRFNPQDLYHFVALFLSFVFPSLIGMVKSGYTWYILGWIGFWLLFFEFWEIRILCSHCPYYAEKSSTLHCIANYGSLKIWKFNPGPITTSEKIQLFTGFIILGGYPFPFLVWGSQFVLAFLAFWALIIFFWTLRKYTCCACVNFSCVLNTVPEDVVELYLDKNPVIKKAWEQHNHQ